MTTRRITFDTVTGRQVDPRQHESFDGRFMTAECRWNGDEWVPIEKKEAKEASDPYRDHFGGKRG